MRLILSLVAVITLTGCQATWLPWKKAPVTPLTNPLGGVVSVTDTAVKKGADAQEKVDQLNQEVTSRVKAHVITARKENQNQPASNPTTIVEGELSAAEAQLEKVKPDQATLLQGEKNKALVESGKADEARRAYAKETEKAKDLLTQLAKAEADRTTAIATAKQAIEGERAATQKFILDAKQADEDFDKKWKDRENVVNQKIKDLEDGIAKKTQFWLTMACYGLGVACFIFVGVRIYMTMQTGGVGLVGGLRSCGIFIFLGLLFFGLGNLVSQPWFWWACGIVLALSVVATGVILVIDSHKTKLVETTRAQTSQVSDDLIGAVHDIRAQLKSPPADLVHKIMSATDLRAATDATKEFLSTVVDPTLSSYVTVADGTAAYVDGRRRALGLISDKK